MRVLILRRSPALATPAMAALLLLQTMPHFGPLFDPTVSFFTDTHPTSYCVDWQQAGITTEEGSNRAFLSRVFHESIDTSGVELENNYTSKMSRDLRDLYGDASDGDRRLRFVTAGEWRP